MRCIVTTRDPHAFETVRDEAESVYVLKKTPPYAIDGEYLKAELDRVCETPGVLKVLRYHPDDPKPIAEPQTRSERGSGGAGTLAYLGMAAVAWLLSRRLGGTD